MMEDIVTAKPHVCPPLCGGVCHQAGLDPCTPCEAAVFVAAMHRIGAEVQRLLRWWPPL